MNKTREEAIAALKAIIDGDPELATFPIANDGKQLFSLNQILKEIENNTEQGQKFVKHYTGVDDSDGE